MRDMFQAGQRPVAGILALALRREEEEQELRSSVRSKFQASPQTRHTKERKEIRSKGESFSSIHKIPTKILKMTAVVVFSSVYRWKTARPRSGVSLSS